MRNARPPLSLHLPSPVTLQCTLQLSGRYTDPVSSPVKICTYSVVLTVHRDFHAVHYIYKRGERGVCTLVLCRLATVTSCIDASVLILTKSPKVGPLLMFAYYGTQCCSSGPEWICRVSFWKSWIRPSSPGATVAQTGVTGAHNGAKKAHIGVTEAHNGTV